MARYETELEHVVVQVLFDPQIRQACAHHLQNWMFQRTIYRYLVETLISENFVNRPIDLIVLRLHMQSKYKDIYSEDWAIVEDLFGKYTPVQSEDVEHVTKIISNFVKNRILLKGVDLYTKGDHKSGEDFFSKASSFGITPDPFVNPLQEGIIEHLRLKDLPAGGRVIRSSLGLVNSALLYKGYKNGDLVMVVMRPKAGKCLGFDTPIVMFDGTIKKAQNVVVGDLLMGADSKPRTVLGTHSDKEMMYEIIPNKGDSYTVNESHILSLIDTRKASTRGIVNMSVRDWLKQSQKFKQRAKGWRTGVFFPKLGGRPLIIAPYFLGLWLGDGTSAKTTITSSDKEICDYIYSFAESLKLSVRESCNSSNCPEFHVNSGVAGRQDTNVLLDEFRRYGLINRTWTAEDYLPFRGKHIPHRYKTGSVEERLELLAGILDADGYLNTVGTHRDFEITQKNEQLLDDIMFLARSLGFACYKKECEKGCQTGAVGTYYRCTINGPVETIPTKIPRKKAEPREVKAYRDRDHLVTGISILKKGEGEYFGFELDGDGLFLLGDFTVTHNSTFMCQEAATAVDQGFKVAHMFFGDFSEYDGLCKFMSCVTGDLMSNVINVPNVYQKRCEAWLKNWRVAAFPASALNTDEIIGYARNFRKKFPFDMLVIDYDSNIRPPEDAGMYETGGVMYSAFKGLGQQEGIVVIIGSQPKIQYWDNEILDYSSAAESSRKQHVVDLMITGGRNTGYKGVGTIHLPLVRRGESAGISRVRFDDFHSRIKEITQLEYDNLIRERKNAHKEATGDFSLQGVSFTDKPSGDTT